MSERERESKGCRSCPIYLADQPESQFFLPSRMLLSIRRGSVCERGLHLHNLFFINSHPLRRQPSFKEARQSLLHISQSFLNGHGRGDLLLQRLQDMIPGQRGGKVHELLLKLAKSCVLISLFFSDAKRSRQFCCRKMISLSEYVNSERKREGRERGIYLGSLSWALSSARQRRKFQPKRLF